MQQQKVKNAQELEKYWDDLSEEYTQTIAESFSILYISMINMIRIEKSKKILEIAVGPGYYLPHLLQRKNKDAELYLTDISSDMLVLAKERIDQFLQNPIQGPYQNFSITNIQNKFTEAIYSYPEQKTHLQVANSEDLSLYKDGEFDTYISSLCLNLTTDPIKQVKEAFRVLSPGGQAIFSVWGDKDQCTMMSYSQKVFQRLGVKPATSERSNFHLNDQQKLVEMFETEGFGNILTWKQFIPMNIILEENDAEVQVNGKRTQNMIKRLNVPDREQEISQGLIDELKSYIKNKQPLGLQALVIKVQKPL